jgi:hypothetical protein
MSDVCLAAIDPGLTGAVAFLFPSDPDRVSVYDMPVVDGEVNVAGLASIIKRYAPSEAILELVGPMPRDGVRQAFRFGGAYYSARAVLQMLNIPTSLVTPATWKRRFRLSGGPEGKEQSRSLALMTFPASAEHFQLKKHHNRSEACLLAKYLAEIRISAAA